jgi:peptidoglycan hydrolase-like protein with peptidoglycan-binding domain
VLNLVKLFPSGRLPRGGPAVFSGLLLRLSSSALIGVLCVSAVSFPSPLLAAAQATTQSPRARPATKKKKSAASRSRRQLAPDPARIKEIQQSLSREGFYQGEPTGKWDDATAAAMKNFQQANGLQPTGKIEALSLQKLGLGSPVAGLAPPTPPASAPPAGAPQKP